MSKNIKTYETDKYLIKIDLNHCIGCGTCSALASQTFEMDKNFKTQVKSPPHDSPEAILSATQACPNNGIILIDKTSGKQVWPK